MRSPSRRGAWWVVAVVGVAACAGGAARSPEEAEPTSQWTRMVVWVGADAYDMHGVRMSADSVSGVAFHDPPDCAECRMRFARADVDSIQVRETPESGDGGTPWSAIIAAATAALLLATVILLAAQ